MRFASTKRDGCSTVCEVCCREIADRPDGMIYQVKETLYVIGQAIFCLWLSVAGVFMGLGQLCVHLFDSMRSRMPPRVETGGYENLQFLCSEQEMNIMRKLEERVRLLKEDLKYKRGDQDFKRRQLEAAVIARNDYYKLMLTATEYRNKDFKLREHLLAEKQQLEWLVNSGKASRIEVRDLLETKEELAALDYRLRAEGNQT